MSLANQVEHYTLEEELVNREYAEELVEALEVEAPEEVRLHTMLVLLIPEAAEDMVLQVVLELLL